MDKTDLRQIGRRIREKRTLAGITQEQLAEKMDVSIQMISNLERGVKAIRIDNLVKLSRILGVTADYILTGEETPIDSGRLAEQLNRLSERERKFVEMTVLFFQKEDDSK